MIQPYMTRLKAIEIIRQRLAGSEDNESYDFRCALALSLSALITEQKRKEPVADPRD